VPAKFRFGICTPVSTEIRQTASWQGARSIDGQKSGPPHKPVYARSRTSVAGTPLKSSASQRFRQVTELLIPCP